MNFYIANKKIEPIDDLVGSNPPRILFTVTLRAYGNKYDYIDLRLCSTPESIPHIDACSSLLTPNIFLEVFLHAAKTHNYNIFTFIIENNLTNKTFDDIITLTKLTK